MVKADLTHLLVTNFNVEPLKAIIRDYHDPDFKGRREDVISWLNDNFTIEQLKDLVGKEIHRFQLDIHSYHLNDDVTFTAGEAGQFIADQSLLDSISSLEGFHDVHVVDGIIVGFVKVVARGFKMQADGEEWIPSGTKASVEYYVPFFVELLPPRYVKIAFSKFEISKGEASHYSGLRIFIQNVDFNSNTLATQVRTKVADSIFACGLTKTNLSNSVRAFAEQQRISALEFGWDDPDGERYKKEGKKNQTLYTYAYVKSILAPALDVGQAK